MTFAPGTRVRLITKNAEVSDVGEEKVIVPVGSIATVVKTETDSYEATILHEIFQGIPEGTVIEQEFTFVEFDSDAIPEGVTLHPDPENQALPSEAFEAVSA